MPCLNSFCTSISIAQSALKAETVVGMMSCRHKQAVHFECAGDRIEDRMETRKMD